MTFRSVLGWKWWGFCPNSIYFWKSYMPANYCWFILFPGVYEIKWILQKFKRRSDLKRRSNLAKILIKTRFIYTRRISQNITIYKTFQYIFKSIVYVSFQNQIIACSKKWNARLNLGFKDRMEILFWLWKRTWTCRWRATSEAGSFNAGFACHFFDIFNHGIHNHAFKKRI